MNWIDNVHRPHQFGSGGPQSAGGSRRAARERSVTRAAARIGIGQSLLDDLDADRLDLGIGVGAFAGGQMHHKQRLLSTDTYLVMFNAGEGALEAADLARGLRAPVMMQPTPRALALADPGRREPGSCGRCVC
jgi:DNA-binding transcriptional LysR family regulator